ncbi:MAG: adenylate/guanylate cyclase domain-containing protein [Nannocystaceae bacterium]
MKVKYWRAGKIVPVSERETILAASIRSKIPHLHECGGLAQCTTCRIRVLDGIDNVSKRTDAEAELARARGWDPYTRLACQTRVRGNVTIQRLLSCGADVSGLQLENIRYGSGKERRLALLFCDMRNFTSFVESHLAHDVVHMMNRFFTALGEPILLNNGMIYQYVGDEIVGLFGVSDDSAERVCHAGIRAGLGMLAALKRLNVSLKRDFQTELGVGIGLHFGRVIVGRMGHPSVEKFAVVGDAINVASRIQTTTRELGVNFLASQEVFQHLPARTARTGLKSEVHLKGKDAPMTVFEVTGLRSDDTTHIVQGLLTEFRQPNSDFGATFYTVLFEMFPEMRAMFPENMGAQKKLMTHMIEAIAYAAGRPENLALGLTELGRQHVNYGVKLEHYPLVRQALEKTVQQLLGNRYTPVVGAAWMGFIDTILQLMAAGSENRQRR